MRSWLGKRLVGLVASLIVVALARPAHAYPWMIRHGHSACVPCHTDPSGEGILTEYGRAQGVILLASRYGAPSDREPGRINDFAFGLVPLPKWLLLQAWGRDGYLWTRSNGELVDHRFLFMRADLGAHASFGQFRAAGQL